MNIKLMDDIISKFAKKHKKLLLLEKEESAQQFLKDSKQNNSGSAGPKINNLSITNVACVIERDFFQIDLKKIDGKPFEFKVIPGDLVSLTRCKESESSCSILKSPKTDQFIKGIVVEVLESTISISTNDQFENVEDDETFTLKKSDSDYTYNIQNNALLFLERRDYYNHEYLPIVEILFEDDKDIVHHLLTTEDPIESDCIDNEGELKFKNDSLAKDQKAAVEFALKRKYFAIIQGPPGTGKTTTLLEIIRQLHRSHKKVLICAPTNVAVDNLVLRLATTEAKPLRLGHPVRIAKEALKYSLDSYVERESDYVIIKKIKMEIKKIIKKVTKFRFQNDEILRILRQELKKRTAQIMSNVLKKVGVILCTLNSSSWEEGQLKYLPSNYFDVLIVDEASQALEASMWVAIPNAKKLILAGDINQLPPLVLSDAAAKDGLNLSLMERAMKKLKDDCFVTLIRQYRMNEKIMSWSNKQFYNNTLVADDLVKKHLLNDLPYIKNDNILTNEAIVHIDTCGCDCEEIDVSKQKSGSKGNLGEVIIVEKIVTKLIEAAVQHKDIGVISPYALQVDLIRKSLKEKSINAEISTVDGFQGSEKEVIILSFVRSNQDRELGFLTDFRRLNVAVTRARRLLIIIADSETMSKNELIMSLLKHTEDNGLLQTAEEYLSERSHTLIEYIVKAKENNKKKNVKRKTKQKLIKQNKKNETESFEIKDTKSLTENVNTKAVPKNRHKQRNFNMNLCKDSFNRFSTISITEVDKVKAQKLEENSSKANLDLESELDHFKNLHITNKETKKKEINNTPNKNKKVLDFDKMVEKFAKSNFVCSFCGCKKSTKLIKIDCEFCKKWFCLEHGLQEIHGCGDAIRRKEYKAFRQKKKPEILIKKLDKDKFAQKLKNFEEARKPKKKSSK